MGTYFWRCNNHPLCSSGSSSTSSMVINALSSASAWALSSKSFRMYSSLVIPIMSKKCSSGSSWSQEKASVERWGGNWMTWWPSKQENVGRLSVLFVVQILPEEETYTDWRYFEPQKQITTSPIKMDQLHDKERRRKKRLLAMSYPMSKNTRLLAEGPLPSPSHGFFLLQNDLSTLNAAARQALCSQQFSLFGAPEQADFLASPGRKCTGLNVMPITAAAHWFLGIGKWSSFHHST